MSTVISNGSRAAALSVLIATLGCSDQPAVGAIKLESVQQMRAFLATGKFSRVGNQKDWWSFKSDGTFTAQLADEHLQGRWNASKAELTLTDLQIATGGGSAAAAPDRKLGLEWQDGKLNINIEDRQYRKYD